jgi:hypothetical protein
MMGEILMGSTSMELLMKENKELQDKLCDEKHLSIDKRLKKIEDSQSKAVAWLIGIMSTVIINLALLIYSTLPK